MNTTIGYANKQIHAQSKLVLPGWQRLILLIILGYEAAGCLLGAILLIASPDGKYMDMPVQIMHGVFRDFLVPGIILFGLGILNSIAFIAVFRRKFYDWFMAGIALGGLVIWFVVEIIILKELHWLHLMWGLPVLVGWIVAIPLIISSHDTMAMRKALLACGILSSLWYIAINIFVPLTNPAYNALGLTVSELSAIDAPTRIEWVLLVMIYPLLYAAFGWGVRKSARGNPLLQMVGTLVLIYSVFNLYWPPMHQREVIAAGGGTLTDTMHIAWAMVTLLLMMGLMGFGAAASGRRFRIFTLGIFVVFIIFGVLTFLESGGIQQNLPTPWIGLWERINIGAFMLWVIVFAFILLQRENTGHIEGQYPSS